VCASASRGVITPFLREMVKGVGAREEATLSSPRFTCEAPNGKPPPVRPLHTTARCRSNR
jgi:hypothetical protein